MVVFLQLVRDIKPFDYGLCEIAKDLFQFMTFIDHTINQLIEKIFYMQINQYLKQSSVSALMLNIAKNCRTEASLQINF